MCTLVLVGTSTLAGAARGKASTAKISAHLTKKSFTKAQAGQVKLVYKFSATSKSFGYLLSFKKGSKWQTVTSVKKRGSFTGSYSMTVKQVFAGESIKVGKYRLRLSADGGHKLLTFKVVFAAEPATKPANTALPTISGTTTQGQKLSASKGSWSNSPTSYSYQWRRCDSSGNGCADVASATSSSYVLVPADVGSTIRVVVAASNSYGSASATSAQTTVANTIPAVSAGEFHSCALLAGGTVKCWGANGFGQLGNGSTTDSSTPVVVSTISNAVAISAGYGHSCALLADGTVKCWGLNGDGQLGDGTTTRSSTPVAASGISNAMQISAGAYHTCAVLGTGAVKCWGLNANGSLGDGTTTSNSTPVAVSGISTATQVSAGGAHSCALLTGGSVKCWGFNGDGQLGDGTTTRSSTPVAVSGIDGVTVKAAAISVGGSHSCALLTDGTVKCWGRNESGQLGDGTTTRSSTPVAVSGISIAIQISASTARTCALLTDGTVKCWGVNSYGQLGDGTTTDSSTPVQVKGVGGSGTLSNVAQISTGESHTCALLSDGRVNCWGANWNGQLGNGSYSYSSTPVAVSGISTATQISAGGYHSCALLADGTVKCWGVNSYGQLGDGTTTGSSNPVKVKGVGGTGTLSNVTQISAGESHTCALLGDHTVECWGYNSSGQLGNGTQANSSIPVQVKGVGGSGTLSNVIQISAGYDHTCALSSDGTVKCWGYNSSGQLGNGTQANSSTPVQVEGVDGLGTLSNVTQISAGGFHTCALLGDHTVECWGYNGDGQLGNGTKTKSSTPVAVSGISNAMQISAGEYHSCAVLSLSTVECWGANWNGQLGDGSTTQSSIPVQVKGVGGTGKLSKVIRISAGGTRTGNYDYAITCAVLADGTVECWGGNENGQLGNGTKANSTTPVVVNGIDGVTVIAADISVGGFHTCALLSDGGVKCWGDNWYGQLGNGEMGYRTTPTSVIGIP